MNIGFISTWFERGAAYVSKAYIEALKDNNKIFVYARGGEKFGKNDPNWDSPYVTWGYKLKSTQINFRHFNKWIVENNIEILFFNEQHEFDIIAYIKKQFPAIKIGSYIDYYKEDSIEGFWLYDFLICNTQRHYSIFKNHPQCYYVPWGTDIELFKPQENNNDVINFFHSVGMSMRKGTKLLLKAFIDGQLYKESRLIIHSQLNFEKAFGYTVGELQKYNIHIIQETVTAPGLYHLGDVYVYPTTLDGLGLTIYEALSCGLPVITTNNAPMNEVVNNEVGFLVDVESYHSRSDGYYWPISICSKTSLIDSMEYYIKHKNQLSSLKKEARSYAVNKLDWKKRYKEINEIFDKTEILDNHIDYSEIIIYNKKRKFIQLFAGVIRVLPNKIEHLINTYIR